jgi:hypothetical protein
LIKQIKSNPKEIKGAIEKLKNNSLFKSFGQVGKELTKLESLIKDAPKLQKYLPTIKSFAKDLSQITPKNLKQNIQNSGIFLESKLKNQVDSKVAVKSLIEKIETIEKEIPKEFVNKSAIKEAASNIKEMLLNKKDLDLKSLKEAVLKLEKLIEPKTKDRVEANKAEVKKEVLQADNQSEVKKSLINLKKEINFLKSEIVNENDTKPAQKTLRISKQ